MCRPSIPFVCLLFSFLFVDAWTVEDYGSGDELMDIELGSEPPAHYRLENYLMKHYNQKLIPRRKSQEAVDVKFRIALYQIVEVNERQQFVILNSWTVESWEDQFLFWLPELFDNITEIFLPHEVLWIPDTTLYNSIVMDDTEARRLQSIKVTTDPKRKTALVELLYPTISKFSCTMNLRLMPFDVQHCTMIFGSWTHDNKYTCCPNNYTLLEFGIHIQRKPTYVLTNLIAPTSLITLIAIVGFFTSVTINDQRDSKIELGITTLLSMSILIFMVSDKLPSTSTAIPLIGWFYTSMMLLIAFATLCSSFVINVQKKGIIGHRPSTSTMRWGVCQEKLAKQQRKQSMWQKPWKKFSRPSSSTLSTMMIPGSLGLDRLADSAQMWQNFSKTTVMKRPEALNLNNGSELMNLSIDEEADRMSDDEEDWENQMGVSSSPFTLNIPNGATNNWPPMLSVDRPRRSSSSISANPNQPSVSIRRRKPRPSSNIPDVLIDGNPLLGSPNTQQRNLAEIEYDWLAAVVERLFLVLFLVLFFFMSVGINAIGGYYWYFTTVDKVDE
ncbi:Acetylcholine receptor subunit alpha-type des-2 [Aphelenchoides besseyi]|nr:Acetylcholine receptor subunit alpha-type des-2 [Aphelenchoides besseyi]